MSKKVKFICRREPRDTVRVESLINAGAPELYLRMETGDVWKGSVILNVAQAQELARRIKDEFGTAPSPTKLWEDL